MILPEIFHSCCWIEACASWSYTITKANAIFAIPIAGLDDVSIFEAYNKKFDELTAKGFKPKMNVMDNQATKHIKNS